MMVLVSLALPPDQALQPSFQCHRVPSVRKAPDAAGAWLKFKYVADVVCRGLMRQMKPCNWGFDNSIPTPKVQRIQTRQPLL